MLLQSSCLLFSCADFSMFKLSHSENKNSRTCMLCEYLWFSSYNYIKAVHSKMTSYEKTILICILLILLILFILENLIIYSLKISTNLFILQPLVFLKLWRAHLPFNILLKIIFQYTVFIVCTTGFMILFKVVVYSVL